MTGTWLGRGNLNTKTESSLIAAKNNALRSNYVIAKIDYKLPCGDRDINNKSHNTRMQQTLHKRNIRLGITRSKR